ncbi:MAG: hypothetical protein M0Z53_07900 [Thermaerobacter sp.]|nr:hypothetical protein [Thermaerobacter sp.]
MPGLTVLILIILGWLVFNWVPGLWFLKHAEQSEGVMEAIIQRYRQQRIDEENRNNREEDGQ